MQRRPRRNRNSPQIRDLVQETRLSVAQLVLPIFLEDGSDVRKKIPSLPGTYRLSVDQALVEIEECIGLGLDKFILFPAVAEALKDQMASYSHAAENYYLEAVRQIKRRFPNVMLISDVAMDPYSSDGHDGIVLDGQVLNDETLPVLAKMAVAQAEAGFDIIAPSDMMDGRVGVIREALDLAGFQSVPIMSYTAKYASAFYGPFRDALDSAPKAGDKKTYQMNPANKRTSLIEGDLDLQEGADFLMVKPAVHYLDIIHLMKESFDLPIAAYHVSGECAMLMAACNNGWLDYQTAMPEVLTSIARAGADVIITYFAKDFAKMSV
ncbi:MAG: porphobilinogen synthase [Saprospiraceae bacterium]|nr:porphobilinogen synthase [Saprospiraceae bacterium]